MDGIQSNDPKKVSHSADKMVDVKKGKAEEWVICPKCGIGNPGAAQFCQICGYSLDKKGNPAVQKTASPESPKELGTEKGSKKKKIIDRIGILLLTLAVIGCFAFLIMKKSKVSFFGGQKAGLEESANKGEIRDTLIENAAWKEAYRDHLLSLLQEDFSLTAKFGLFYIDGDNIPELVVSPGSGHFVGCYIASYNNEELCISDYLGSCGCIAFGEKTGIIVSNYNGSGANCNDIFRLQNGVVFQEFECGSWVDWDNSDDENDSYFYDILGNDATKEEYYAALEQYIPDNLIATGSEFGPYPQDYSADYDGMSMHRLCKENVELFLDVLLDNTLGKRHLTEIVIPDGVLKIGDSAFEGCTDLTEITIPPSVRSIGDCAFLYCENLTDVTVPSSVVSIGDSAFRGCKKLSDKNGFVLVKDILFDYFGQSEKVVIPDGVKTIKDFTFSYKDFTGVTIPSSVKSIGDYAFNDCDNLAEVSYKGTGRQWKTIKIGAHNESLLNASITSNTEENTQWSFDETTGMLTINDNGIINNYGNHSFPWNEYRDKIKKVVIADGITKIDKGAFRLCSSLTSVVIPKSVTIIGDSAFYGCTALSNITIPSSVTSIGDFAFSGCSSLSALKIPNSLKSIGNSAFSGCYNLTGIIIPDSVAYIGDNAFKGCKKLSDQDGFVVVKNILFDYLGAGGNVVIPENVTIISNDAFRNCSTLSSIAISSNITNIGHSAFLWCNALMDVYYQGDENQWLTIIIDENNDCLTNAAIHYRYSSVYSGDGSDEKDKKIVLGG